MIYRIGKITCSEKIGYYGALFFTVAYFPLELFAGRYSTDHNDLSFLVYINASFWAWFEYMNSGKKYWLLVIGLFSGFAVLVKWLVGLLIFSVWMVTIIFTEKENWKKINSYFPFMLSLFISVLVFMPWQFFIFYKYPIEANYEFLYNTKHFFESLEYHGGDFLFHIKAIKDIYGRGQVIPFFYLLGIAVYLKKMKSNV
jgi:4-amino-4-deoxy-L-arabinose transferase-like glycosyltransferase